MNTKELRMESRERMYPSEKFGQPVTYGCLTVKTFNNAVSGTPCVLMFKGTSAKPLHYYKFGSPERRQAFIETKVKEWADIEARKNQWRNERKQKGSDIVVGDILYNSWGYDQTNIDFYQVTKATQGRLWIVGIGAKSVGCQGNSMSDMVVADPSHQGTTEKMVSRQTYQKWDGRALYRSWYA